MRIDDVVLERIAIGFTKVAAASDLHLMSPEFSGRAYGELMMLELRGYLWGKQESVSVSFPASWWQAVKARWLPGWAKRRWPVRVQTVKLEAAALWPSLQYLVPDHQPVLKLRRIDGWTVGAKPTAGV